MRRSLAERILLPYSGEVPPAKPRRRQIAFELLRTALFLPYELFIWAVFLARLAYLIVIHFQTAGSISRSLSRLRLIAGPPLSSQYFSAQRVSEFFRNL